MNSFSLFIIIWELWYGEDVADHIGFRLGGKRLEEKVARGLRPDVDKPHRPPDDWVHLLRSGWELKAAKRPTSRDVADFFENFLKDN